MKPKTFAFVIHHVTAWDVFKLLRRWRTLASNLGWGTPLKENPRINHCSRLPGGFWWQRSHGYRCAAWKAGFAVYLDRGGQILDVHQSSTWWVKQTSRRAVICAGLGTTPPSSTVMLAAAQGIALPLSNSLLSQGEKQTRQVLYQIISIHPCSLKDSCAAAYSHGIH